MSGEQLGQILRDQLTMRLVVLNACEGARVSADDPFSGVATRLIHHGIPSVIGMQFEISDRAAILFASDFYAATKALDGIYATGSCSSVMRSASRSTT